MLDEEAYAEKLFGGCRFVPQVHCIQVPATAAGCTHRCRAMNVVDAMLEQPACALGPLCPVPNFLAPADTDAATFVTVAVGTGMAPWL